jgi:hypothetical protein
MTASPLRAGWQAAWSGCGIYRMDPRCDDGDKIDELKARYRNLHVDDRSKSGTPNVLAISSGICWM